MPLPVELTKGALDKLHLHGRWRDVGVFRGEALPDTVVINGDRGHESVAVTLFDIDATAPRQKSRIVFDFIDQREHLRSAVAVKDGFVYNCHGAV